MQQKEQAKRAGVDVGEVVLRRKNPGGKNSFYQGNHLLTPFVSGAIYWIRQLRNQGIKVWLISYAGEEFCTMTDEVFSYRDFYGQTLVSPDHVIYVPDRSLKADVCEEYGITDFVDDRFGVHQSLALLGIRQFLFNPTPADADLCRAHLPHIPQVMFWKELARKHLLMPAPARA